MDGAFGWSCWWLVILTETKTLSHAHPTSIFHIMGLVSVIDRRCIDRMHHIPIL
jgi:uncharacterized membrane protein YedE/YeeE